MPSPPDQGSALHVFIVNFNSSEDLAKCVASLGSSALCIHVHDNGSSAEGEVPRLNEIARRHANVRVTTGHRNVGFGAAINRMIDLAEIGDHDDLWVLNPDTLVDATAMEALRETVSWNPSAIVSPVITTGDQEESIWYAGGTVDRRRGTHLRQSLPEGTAPIACGFMAGTAMLFRLPTWRRIGGFREDLFLYWEDAELSLRAQEQGVTLLIDPRARIWHRVGASTGASPKSLVWYRYITRNRVVVCADGRLDAILMIAVRGLPTTARLFARAFREPGHSAPRVAAIIQGYLEGFRALPPR